MQFEHIERVVANGVVYCHEALGLSCFSVALDDP